MLLKYLHSQEQILHKIQKIMSPKEKLFERERDRECESVLGFT